MNAGSERKKEWMLVTRTAKGKKKVVGKEEAETKNDLLRDEKRDEKWKRQTVKRVVGGGGGTGIILRQSTSKSYAEGGLSRGCGPPSGVE